MTGPPLEIAVLVVAVSTGGPNALATLLPSLPEDFPVPILVVQHMPATFTRSLAERLDSMSSLQVREAMDGAALTAGTVWIAPGGRHMEVAGTRYDAHVRLQDDAPENSCRPAADVLFRSAARLFRSQTLALVLTGMGKDGLQGSRDVVAAGGLVLAQDQATSVVYGMPGFVAAEGLAEAVLPLEQIGPALVQRLMAKRPAVRSCTGRSSRLTEPSP